MTNNFVKNFRTCPKSFLTSYFGIFLAIFSKNFLEYRKYFKKFFEKKSKNRAKYEVKKDLGQVLIVFLFITSLFSCSSDNKIDDKNAISVFADLDLIQADPTLKNVNITIPATTSNQSWFGNNNDNNQKIENFAFGNDGSKEPISKIKSIWSGYRTGYDNRMVFAPTIVGDKIYTLDANSNLYAKDLATYKTIWKKKLINRWFIKDFTNGKISYFDGKNNAPPSFTNVNSVPLNRGIIFATTGYNLVFCVDAKTGEIIWQKTLSSIPISTPISDGNQVYLITDDNKTYALSAATGEINWVHSGILKATGILGSANPVLYKNYVISSYSSGEIYTLNKKTGDAGWVYDLNLNKVDSSDFVLNDIDATPVVKNDVVYTIGNGGLMMAIRIIDGAILWQKELASITDFWIAGDFIYLVNNDNQLISLSKKTGGIKWLVQLKKYLNDKKPTSKIVYNGIIMAGNNLIMSNSNRELLVILPLDGKVLQTKKLDQQIFHNSIVVNGKIYLHTIGRFTTDLVVVE